MSCPMSAAAPNAAGQKCPLEKNGVVPDVLDTLPKHSTQVTYANGVKVDMGNVLTPTQVKDAPTLVYPVEKETLYTVCMTDPDAPNRQNPKFREWHHWLVVNVPGHDVTKGDVMSAYIGAAPPKDSGLHRYVFAVYKQPGKMNCTEKKLGATSGEGRGKFKLGAFARKYNLGEPISANFFQAQWDDYVPTLYKKLGM